MVEPDAFAPVALDVKALFIVATCITALLGLLLLFAYFQDRIKALAWWGTAYLIAASRLRSGASRASSRRRCRPAPPTRSCSSPAG